MDSREASFRVTDIYTYCEDILNLLEVTWILSLPASITLEPAKDPRPNYSVRKM